MPADLETEFIQLLAATDVINDVLTEMLKPYAGSFTVPMSGVRSGNEHEIVGLSQILILSQAYTLELSIKLLTRSIPGATFPRRTHNLTELFAALPDRNRKRLEAVWAAESERSKACQALTLSQFLDKHRMLFEESRYLFERERSAAYWGSTDATIAILVVLGEVIHESPDTVLLQQVYEIAQSKLSRMGKVPLPPWSDITETIQ